MNQVANKKAETAAQGLRDRVVEFRRIASEELLDNEQNWRVHPYAQTAALSELLGEIGIVGALTAYRSERNGGKLTLIDGHERRSHQADWPVLILDVNDEEADLLLLTLDPLRELAQTDGSQLQALLDQVQAGTPGLVDMLQSLEAEAQHSELDEGPKKGGGPGEVLPEMELQPYEHYDYVVLLCRNTYDWMGLQDLLGLERQQFTVPTSRGTSKTLGMGRVVDAKRVIDLLKPPDAA
jgi:hypothetical protein